MATDKTSLSKTEIINLINYSNQRIAKFTTWFEEISSVRTASSDRAQSLLKNLKGAVYELWVLMDQGVTPSDTAEECDNLVSKITNIIRELEDSFEQLRFKSSDQEIAANSSCSVFDGKTRQNL